MSGGVPCEGYACPPTHSVPASEVIVHRPATEHLANTGVPDPTGLIAVSIAFSIGAAALFGWARAGRKKP